MFPVKRSGKALVNGTFPFITIHLLPVVSPLCSLRSLSFLRAPVLLSPKLCLPLSCPFVAAPNTMTASETPTSNPKKRGVSLALSGVSGGQACKGQIRGRRHGRQMKRASGLKRGAKPKAVNGTPSSCERRGCLYIAVIMGCNAFVNGGDKDRGGALVPNHRHLGLLLSCFLFLRFFLLWRGAKREAGEGVRESHRPPTSLPMCLTTGSFRRAPHFPVRKDPQSPHRG